jgi:glycolate oxidase
MDDIAHSLAMIVGKAYFSNQPEEAYFYARDPGLMPPHKPDYVVVPKSVEEIQEIVRLAGREKIPLVPMGAGLALTGLTIPLKGGIVIDMKRMNRILKVNEKARHVIVEGGTSQGLLKAYLEKNYPRLRHSMPDSPATATIAAGLFLGWFGATGIITKVAVKLYPKKKMRDVEIFITDREDLVPDMVYELTHTEMVEDINIFAQPKPMIFKDNHHIAIFITGDTDEEIEFKRKMTWYSLDRFIKSKDGGFMGVPPVMKPTLLEMPQRPTLLEMPQRSVSRFADVKKGGGFEYSGPIIMVEKYPECTHKIVELAEKYDLGYSGMARIIGRSHAMMYGFAFTFNRADPDMMDRTRKALHEVSEFALEAGGIFWKATVDEQQMAIKKMDPNTLGIMKMIKENLDPNGIMNPGNWEVI